MHRDIELTPGADSDSDAAYKWYERNEEGTGGYFAKLLLDLLEGIQM